MCQCYDVLTLGNFLDKSLGFSTVRHTRACFATYMGLRDTGMDLVYKIEGVGSPSGTPKKEVHPLSTLTYLET